MFYINKYLVSSRFIPLESLNYYEMSINQLKIGDWFVD